MLPARQGGLPAGLDVSLQDKVVSLQDKVVSLQDKVDCLQLPPMPFVYELSGQGWPKARCNGEFSLVPVCVRLSFYYLQVSRKITMGTENIRSNGIRADSYYMSVASEQTGLRLKLPGCKSDNFGVWWLKLCECELFQRELCPSTLWLSKFKLWTLRVWTLWISASLFLCVIGLWDHSIRSRHILA